MTILIGEYSFGFWQSFFSRFRAEGKNSDNAGLKTRWKRRFEIGVFSKASGRFRERNTGLSLY